MGIQPFPQRGAGRPIDPDKRERLLDVAIELFAERGIANTTVARIAAAGQVTSAMVHYWFDTRDKLLDAVAEERLAPQMGHVWAQADPEHDTALELVQGLVSRMLAVTKEAPWLPSLWLREIVQEGGLLRERALSRLPRDAIAAFRTKIAAAQARGEINPDISPDLLFISMLGLVMLPLATARIWHRVNPNIDVSRAQLESHVTALLLNGVAGGAPAKNPPSHTRKK